MDNNKNKKWNAIVSAIADPVLRRAAEKFVSSIPEDSWLRSELAERILAGLKGLAESYKGSGVSGLIVEKVTDFFDFASSSLFKNKGDQKSFSAITHNWIQKFWEESQKKLSESPLEKLGEIRERILEEFKIRTEIFQIVLETEKKFRAETPTKNKKIDWTALDAQMSGLIEQSRPRWLLRRPKEEGKK